VTRTPLDLRLVPAAVGAWLGGLLGVSVPTRSAEWAAGVLCMVCAGSWALSRRLPGVLVVLAMACGCAAATTAAGAWRLHVVHSGPVASLAGESASVRADLVVSADPVPVQPRVRGNSRVPDEVAVRAVIDRLNGGGLDLAVQEPVLVVGPRAGWSSLLPSQRVVTTGRLREAGPTDDITAVLTVRGPPLLVGQPSAVQRAAGALRERLRTSVTGLGPDERGLVPGLVDGDTSALPPTTSADFRTAGLTHLTAVSGANVAFVLAAVLIAARWVGLRGYAIPAAGLAGLGGFLVLARPEPSVLRASLMALIAVLATMRGGVGAGRASALAPLSASVLGLVLLDPFIARTAGFVLSVLATAGVVVLAPRWRVRWGRRLPTRIAEGLAVAAAAQVATAPALLLINPAVSLVSVPANMLAEPAVPGATVLGVVVAVLGPISPPLARLVARAAAVPAAWIATVAHVAAGLPLATVAWPAGIPGAALLVAALVGARRGWSTARTRPVVALAIGTVGAATLVPPVIHGSGWPPHGWLLVACDVGQGDGLAVSTGVGAALVIDAGPDPRAIDRCLRDLHVDRVPLLLLTHFHADHVEGVPGVLQGRSVAEIEVSPLAEPPDEAARVRAWAHQDSVPVTVATAGEHRSAGAVTWTVLWPRRIIRAGSVPNNASVVLRLVSSGVVILLTGDVEPEAQQELLADPAELRADVLKVPHHGSANQDPAFIRAVGAGLAVISVGVGNPYRHPAPSTLRLLESLGMQVARTDDDGDVAAVRVGAGIALVERRSS
jgi:competence protein ComEC